MKEFLQQLSVQLILNQQILIDFVLTYALRFRIDSKCSVSAFLCLASALVVEGPPSFGRQSQPIADEAGGARHGVPACMLQGRGKKVEKSGFCSICLSSFMFIFSYWHQI